MEIILRNHQAGAYRADEITIISPYKAQNFFYRQRLFALVADGRLPSNAVPTVATIDFQSRSDHSGLGVSQAENFGDIGFTADDHRGNVLSVFAYERSAHQHSASRYSFWELRSHPARD
ncbi:hypothetical protein DTO212C5_9197 [Paecilomyces variotii]|nr:hypothetical protein DTO212C5_9197 [Paecilomyces variotii]